MGFETKVLEIVATVTVETRCSYVGNNEYAFDFV